MIRTLYFILLIRVLNKAKNSSEPFFTVKSINSHDEDEWENYVEEQLSIPSNNLIFTYGHEISYSAFHLFYLYIGSAFIHKTPP